MELYITRHGETSWNYENKILGRTDIPLNERGRAQARELAEKLKDVEIDVIIASPLSRALETATYIANAKNMPIRTDERLVEIDFGVFEGQDRACPEYQNSKREYFKKYSLGESFLQLTGRICCCLDMLKKEYPDAGCTLDYDQAWKLLVSVRLAAQCTDARVNVVVEGLYEKYPDIDALAAADVDDIEKIVRPCGLGKSKARDISACMKMLKEEYGGKVPKDFNALLKLPGVGRKSANLIMGDVFGEPAIVTDTHCIRLTNRMGLVDGIKDPKKVEMALWKIIPPEEGSDFCHRLVYHGRDVCTARTKPYCDKCCLQDICAKNGVE